MLKTLRPRQPWTCERCIRRQKTTRRWFTATRPTASYGATTPAAPAHLSAPDAAISDRTLRQIFDSSHFWRDFSRSFRGDSGRKNVGLLHNGYLTGPKGFEEFATSSLGKAQRIVDKVLRASSTDEYRSLVKDLDRLSDILCRVIDLSDFVRATHPDPQMQQAASAAYSVMFEYMNVLNTTAGLDEQLKVAMATSEVAGGWSEEEKTVAEILKRDFAKSAIDLPLEQRRQFVSLSQDIAEVGTAFVERMEPAQRYIKVLKSRLRGLDPLTVRQYSNGKSASLLTMGRAVTSVLHYGEEEETRRMMYSVSRTASASQIQRLETLLARRFELAKLSGFESYAHMALGDKMAKSPDSVWKFLKALAAKNGSKVDGEVAELLKLRDSPALTGSPSLHHWDKDFYIEKALSKMRPTKRRSDFLSAYFSLGTVMQGLSRLFSRLYGIRLVPRETQPGEAWNSDVRRLDAISDTDGHVAVLYCDLFSRPGKSPNPAHFTLRCSRELGNSEIQEAASIGDPRFDSPESAANDGMAISSPTTVAHSGGVVKQLPTIALICDFSTPPTTSSFDGHTDNDKPTLLSFEEVQTLFHEMGHAIHSILGRTSLQNVSGTRCATDFAELPSVLMEHFAADASVLALFARHHETDRPLPYELVREKLALEKRFECFDLQTQILLSMLDQAVHSSSSSSSSSDDASRHLGAQPFSSSTPSSSSATRTWLDLQTRYSPTLGSDPAGTSYPAFFGHLYGYGSSYYSYLFDRVLADRIWQQVFGGGGLSGGGGVLRANGERMREKVLRWGGARDPWRCLADVLGDERVEKGGDRAMEVVGGWGMRDEKAG